MRFEVTASFPSRATTTGRKEDRRMPRFRLLTTLAAALLTLSATACGNAKSGAPAAVATGSETQAAQLAPLPANQRQMSDGFSIPITHTGRYEWESEPNPSLKTGDVWGQGGGFYVRGGTVEYVDRTPPRTSVKDTSAGLVLMVTFDVATFEGKPTLYVTRTHVAVGSPD
jgi:hypothetical protein